MRIRISSPKCQLLQLTKIRLILSLGYTNSLELARIYFIRFSWVLKPVHYKKSELMLRNCMFWRGYANLMRLYTGTLGCFKYIIQLSILLTVASSVLYSTGCCAACKVCLQFLSHLVTFVFSVCLCGCRESQSSCQSCSQLLTKQVQHSHTEVIHIYLLDHMFELHSMTHRVRPNFVFVFCAENANFWWFRSLSFSAENDVAFSFSVETQNENTEIH